MVLKQSRKTRTRKGIPRLKSLNSRLLWGRHKTISQELSHDSYFWQSRPDFNTGLKICFANNYCLWSCCWGIYFFNDRLWDNPVYLRTILYDLGEAGPLPWSVVRDSRELGFHGYWLMWFGGNHWTSLMMMSPPSLFLSFVSSVNTLCLELFYWWLNNAKSQFYVGTLRK